MPHTKKPRRFLTPLVLFTLAGWALWALGRNEPETSETSATSSPEISSAVPPARPRATWSRRRLATSLAFATLFFGGAAFSAGAGDVVAGALENGDTATEATSTEEAPGTEEPTPDADQPADEDGQPAEGDEGEPADNGEAPADEADQPADDGDQPAEGESPADPGDGEGTPPPPLPDDPAEGQQPDNGEGTPPPPLPDDPGDDDGNAPADPPPDPGVGDGPADTPAPHDLPVIDKKTRSPAHLDPEANADGFFATIWLHRPLPDPTPPAKRLKPSFARALAHEARSARVDWALVLGVLRARGFDGGSMSLAPVRATARALARLDARRHPVKALRAYGGRKFADEALALSRYDRAVGLRSLVQGFEASKGRLQRMVLRDDRLDIYQGGRLDIAHGPDRRPRPRAPALSGGGARAGDGLVPHRRPSPVLAAGSHLGARVRPGRGRGGAQRQVHLRQPGARRTDGARSQEHPASSPPSSSRSRSSPCSAWVDRPSRWQITTTTSTWAISGSGHPGTTGRRPGV